MVKDEKLKRRLRELVNQAEDEGKGGKDISAIKRALKVMGDEVENSEDMKEEEKIRWREQEKNKERAAKSTRHSHPYSVHQTRQDTRDNGHTTENKRRNGATRSKVDSAHRKLG